MDSNLTFLTPKEVAQILRLNLLTIYEYIRNGSLRTVRLGRSYRIKDQDLEKFIFEHLTSVREEAK